MSYKTIESNVKKLRDPFVLKENGIYYMYGSEWECYKTNGDFENWKRVEKEIVTVPKEFVKNKWAPEVHKYNGNFYMFTTYFSSKTNHRGCTILKSSSPEGPFEEITNGHITPHDWDSIDATLYIDKNNNPWMVFVHEWTSMPDKVGTMAAARLSEDFTHFVSEPIELFRADEPEWARAGVTDGCFMYRTKEDKLLMIWSNFEKGAGYCTAIAESDNGEIDGNWSHQKELLFSEKESGNYDGGHAMIFKDGNNNMLLSLHSPNTKQGEREEMPVFVYVKEENETLVCVKQ